MGLKSFFVPSIFSIFLFSSLEELISLFVSFHDFITMVNSNVVYSFEGHVYSFLPLIQAFEPLQTFLYEPSILSDVYNFRTDFQKKAGLVIEA